MSYGIKDIVKDGFNGKIEIASKQLSDARYALCNVCPHLRRNIEGHADQKSRISGEKCNLCGCYMPVKSTLVKASCPVGKW